MVLSYFIKGRHSLNVVIGPHLYTQGYSTLGSPPTALGIQSPREPLQYTAGFSAGSHSSMSLSTDSMNSTLATVHQLPKQKERQCKEMFQ